MNTFTAARWLNNKHLQTLGSVIVPRYMKVLPSVNRVFKLTDGSMLRAECSWQKQKNYLPTILIVPGLNGSTISSYIRGTAAKAYAAGFNVVRINLRNGGNSGKLSKTLLHAGQSVDIVEVIQELVSVDRLAQIGIISFSFGGNICLKAVAEWGRNVPKELIGIVGISPLIDLEAAADSIDRLAPPIYCWQMLRGLKSSFRARSKLFPGQYDTEALNAVTTFRGYDELCAPYNGFVNAADYYTKSSALPLLTNINLPTLLIQADDDPVIPARSFDTIQNNLIEVVITCGGGHGGFISAHKESDYDRHWAESRAVEFFQSHQ